MKRVPTMTELLEWIKEHTYVYYHAPLDVRPYSVRVKQYTIDNDDPLRSRATLWTSETRSFRVNLAQHLERFRIE